MHENEILLNPDLAFAVLKILHTNPSLKPHKKEDNGTLSLYFTRLELETITNLSLINPTSNICKDIKMFPNLSMLTIKTMGENQYKTVRQTSSINDNDLKEIASNTNIRTLIIENQTNITKIDLSNLKNIKNLSLKRNINLSSVDGLLEIDKLCNLEIYGNSSLSSIKSLDKILEKNNIVNLNLDVLLYPDAIGYNGSDRENEVTKEKINGLADRCNWVESYEEYANVILNNMQMNMLHTKAIEIAKDIISKSSGKKDYIIGTDMFLSENVVYDSDGLGNVNKMLNRNGIAMGPKYGTVSTFNALVLNSSSCDGYTRAMQYLLKLAGIESRNVCCKAANYNSEEKAYPNQVKYNMPELDKHSIVCIKGFEDLYSDPCFNAYEYQKSNGLKYLDWSLLTKSEIMKDHTLSYAENNVINDIFKQSKYDIAIIGKKYMNNKIEKER